MRIFHFFFHILHVGIKSVCSDDFFFDVFFFSFLSHPFFAACVSLKCQNNKAKDAKQKTPEDFMSIVLIWRICFFRLCSVWCAWYTAARTVDKWPNAHIKVENVFMWCLFARILQQSNQGSNMCDSVSNMVWKRGRKGERERNPQKSSSFIIITWKFASARFWNGFVFGTFFVFVRLSLNSFHNLLSSFSCVIHLGIPNWFSWNMIGPDLCSQF